MADNYIGRRADRERRRRKSGYSWLAVPAILIILGAIVWIGYTSMRPTRKADGGRTVTIKVERPRPKKVEPVIAQKTFVVLGIEEKQGQKKIAGALQIVFDPAGNRLGGLIIDPNTYASVPGRGLQPIADGYTEKPENLASAVGELSGVEPQGYITFSSAEFSQFVQEKKVAEFFSEYAQTNIPETKIKALSQRMAGLPKERVNLVPLPVKSIVIGQQTYYEPNKEELERLVKSIWGKLPRKSDKPIRVIILNGSGVPGVGRTAADRLIGKGFRIIDVKNADNFNYQSTEVLLYNKGAEKTGPALVKALGTGKLVRKGTVQDVTDIVIVLGKDFH